MDDPCVGGQVPGQAPDVAVVADEDQLDVGMRSGEVEGPGHDLGRAVVAAHRVEGDADHRVSGRRRRCCSAGLGGTARRPW